MLSFNVSQLLKQGVGASRCYVVSGELFDIDGSNAGPVPAQGEVWLIRTPQGILVRGRVGLMLVQPCRRCLELTDNSISIRLEEEFCPSIDIETGASLPITEDMEGALLIDEHHILDLTQVLGQHAFIAVASLGLCRPDCRGLCPDCGSNLNTETCTCDRARLDPRLSALAALLPTDHDIQSSK